MTRGQQVGLLAALSAVMVLVFVRAFSRPAPETPEATIAEVTRFCQRYGADADAALSELPR